VNAAIIFKLIGMMLLALAGSFSICIAAGTINGETFADTSIQAFLLTITIALVLSAVFHVLGRRGDAKFFRREALCGIGISWLLATFIGAIPYWLIVEDCSIANAIFESSSGLTTTGATAFPQFYEFPHSLLFWRSLSQWLGGLGVVVLFVALLS
jgi:trk system potassium uptake protein TrkH